ncbi:MAG: hypothetical protein DMG00_11080, partial [Acidobacteria bacterium]
MAHTENLDALVKELNAGVRRAPREDEHTARLRSWLEQVVERNASDLLLVAGAPPSVRIDGLVTALHEGPLSSEE